MSASLARPMLRAPMRIAGRRYESTASSAASTAGNAAGNAASKASQGLSKVTSAAGPAIAGAARGVSNALGKIGGRTGRLINFVQGAFFLSGYNYHPFLGRVESRGNGDKHWEIANSQCSPDSLCHLLRQGRP